MPLWFFFLAKLGRPKPKPKAPPFLIWGIDVKESGTNEGGILRESPTVILTTRTAG
jgi:hypothetical protein